MVSPYRGSGFFATDPPRLKPSSHTTGVSVYSGVSLVMLGVVVNVAAVVYHVRTVRRLQSGTWEPGLSMNAIVLALILAAIGLGMGLFLLILR